ncbi:MAG: DEAD/DEAH box helicase [Planctomycetes bacterium]|nr:DEAD/DEAH box helicase [Planctomycetota bacterium]
MGKQSFKTFGLGPKVRKGLAEAGYESPRPIQAKAIAPILEGRDLLGLAQTGTGKTAAFLVPLLERLSRRRASGPRLVVLAPTRELATQIHAEAERLGRYTGLRAALVVGGVPTGPQSKALAARPELVVATPGRLLDLLNKERADLGRVEAVVLDEADHMLELGFLPAIRELLEALPAKRQTLFFSATLPHEVRALAERFLSSPHRVELAPNAPAAGVEHALCAVRAKDKLRLLTEVLGERGFEKGIVFLRTKQRARELARDLDEAGHRCTALHGDLTQRQRDEALGGFREGRYDVLVATDLAARGLDVAGVSHVVNYDVPGTAETYTHRLGRTGRGEAVGKALTFVTHADRELVAELEAALGEPLPRRRMRDFAGEGDAPRPAGAGRRGAARRGRARGGAAARRARASWRQRARARRGGRRGWSSRWRT